MTINFKLKYLILFILLFGVMPSQAETFSVFSPNIEKGV